ncbi:M4 family metallopeptidase [Duganella qianjiadongensis]|uniref:M4 family peptidase n=1 Tax=Duganella qianjiadongensis TaxID=2692176 RepID=A0ABW9VPB4_9BURK|nr:M4 family metallopeptidase [Duganella qianjiadongensis]MYM40284.1 M4 family peptidase [Duganella qianjiadongensis]
MNLPKTVLAASIVASLPVLALPSASMANQLMSAPVAKATPEENQGLLAQLMARDADSGLTASHSMRIDSQHPGLNGEKIVRLQHTYAGLPIFGSESVVLTDSSGKILSTSVADRRTALDGPTPEQADSTGRASRPTAFDTTPAISSADAINQLVQTLAPAGVHRWAPRAELMIYPVMKTVRIASAAGKTEKSLNALDLEEQIDHYELAYYVQLRMASEGKPLYYDVIVNATTGAVLARWKALKTVVGTGNSQYNGAVPINTSQTGNTYQMLDSSRGTGGKFGGMAITNANHSSANSPSPGSIYTNSSNTWGDGKQYVAGGSTTNANGQTAAVNALWGLMNTYDTLKNALGWHSLDGNNTATYIAAHVDNNYDNAFYDDDCKCMYIGDGSSFNSLGAIDVIGHEMSHGVTASTANLVYSGESGGLNESNSDIGGEMVEAYARAGGSGSVIPASGNDWMMGKEISKTGQPLRWMYKPSKDGSSPDAWSSSLKNLDVHYTSGPNNRMFYFLSQGSSASSTSDYYSKFLVKSPAAMTGIGSDKAYRIWFLALTTKFTSTTNYADARSKVLAAAQELYGTGSREAIAVQRAYAAINVGSDIDEAGGGGSVAITTQPASISVAAGASASFSVAAAGGTPPYTYQWYRNDAAISGATAASYSFPAQAGDDGAVFYATIRDASSPPQSVSSARANLSVGSSAVKERVSNGGFEAGATGWSGTTGVIGSFSGQSAFEGSKYAWLGGNGRSTTETLSQALTIPGDASSATLSFALHIDTAESGSKAYDKMIVAIKNSSGTTLATLASYSNTDAASGYQTRSFNLLPYKGQTVTLSFSMTEDSTLQTSFVLDKVSLLTQ